MGWREEKVRDVGEHESGRMHALHASQTMSGDGGEHDGRGGTVRDSAGRRHVHSLLQ